jgi:Ras family
MAPVEKNPVAPLINIELVIGDTLVGKYALILRFSDNQWREDQSRATIGADFCVR